MGLGDKFKDLRKQTQDAVAGRREEIQNAVQAVGAAANERTQGKYADRIAKVGDKVSSTVDKISSDKQSGDVPEAAAATPPPSDASATPDASAPSGAVPSFEPTGGSEPESAEPEAPSSSAPDFS